MKKKITLFLVVLISFVVVAQEEQVADTIAKEFVKVEGDSIFRSSISLDEVYIFGKLKFSTREDKLRYYILRRKTIKVYPYAKLASERLVQLNDSLNQIGSKGKKRKYTRKIHKVIEEEFAEELKKLTRTEGQILIKLIHRQTGTTSFDLVKELRNGWRAFWYNATAKAFKISIKEEFHPENVHEDYLIEDILQRAFADNRLERQKSVLDYDYASLSNRWKKPTK